MTVFVPNKKKFKKSCKGRNYGLDTGHRNLEKYDYGIQCIGRGRIESKHIEAARKTITNFYKRNVKLFIKIYPNRSYTSKPAEVRMGRGKGGIVGWYFNIKPGCIFIEFTSDNEQNAKKLVSIVSSKMPFRCILSTSVVKSKQNDENVLES